VLAHDSAPVYDLFKFRRFRLNVIGFLRLPLGINESTLRDVIKGCSVNLLAHYMARAERVAAQAFAPVVGAGATKTYAPPVDPRPRHFARAQPELRAHG
jgi:hypothetical protein